MIFDLVIEFFEVKFELLNAFIQGILLFDDLHEEVSLFVDKLLALIVDVVLLLLLKIILVWSLCKDASGAALEDLWIIVNIVCSSAERGACVVDVGGFFVAVFVVSGVFEIVGLIRVLVWLLDLVAILAPLTRLARLLADN